MEILTKIRDVVHGWSEETRKFLAMATMGIGILVFFSVWISSVSSGLVAIGPSAPTASAPVAAVSPPSNPMAFLPSSSGPEDGSAPADSGAELAALPFADQNTPQVPSAPIEPLISNPLPAIAEQKQAPTPLQGVAETFGGIRQLFRTTDSSDTIEGRARAAGSWLWNAGMSIISWAEDFLLWLGGALYQRMSALIAS